MKTSISPHNCNVVFDNGYTTSGIYTINVGGKATQVYCDMETDGGGWIVSSANFMSTDQIKFANVLLFTKHTCLDFSTSFRWKC